MAVSGKAIKQRIKSVKNTKKITKALEMVSAAKMRKAIQSATATRTYAVLAKDLMERLGTSAELTNPLTEHRTVKNVLVVLITSNMGLAGSFNANILKKTRQLLMTGVISTDTEVQYEIIGIGKKSAYFAKRFGYPLIQVYDSIRENPTIDDISPIISYTIEQFTNKKYDAVVVAYTDFKSTILQAPKVRKLLPITTEDIDAMLADLGSDTGEKHVIPVGTDMDYEFEPNKALILETILPRLFEVQLYQALLESRASEHSARMMAMKNANEAAGDMIDSLTVEFNKARQAAITKEIAEIVGGAAALE